MLVLAGPPGEPAWSNAAAATDFAYAVLRARRFVADRIRYLADAPRDADQDGTNDVNDVAGAQTLRFAITNWAASAGRLVVYVGGTSVSNQVVFAGGTALSASDLDAWLDSFQSSNRAVTAIMDVNGGGAYVTNLLPPAGRDRVVIASTRAWHPRLLDEGGVVSFSHYFWNQILGGQTIGESFNRAKKAIRRVSGAVRQRAELDDDGDGIPNEKNVDGSVALSRYIGTAFLTGDDAPNIGSVIPPTLLTASDSLLVWAADVTDVNGISNVWCVLTPPTYAGTNALLQTNLAFNASSNRYEALLSGLTNPGSYTLTFYAQDALGELSQAVQSEILRADAYEVDDVPGDDTLYFGPAQFHNFHHTGDVDWVRFYAVSNYAYDISTFPLGTNCDTVLDLYREETNGALTLLDSVDDFGSDDGELLGLDFPSNGFYAVRVSPYLTNDWQPGSYELDITIPAGGGPLIVYAFSRLLAASALPPGVVARVGDTVLPFNGQLSVTFGNLPGGVNTVTVTNLPAGYRPAEATNAAGQVDNPDNIKFGNPRHIGVNADPNTVVFAYFTFIPTLQALGRARDAWTGQWIDGAAIEFTATTLSNLVYSRYPNASYATPWVTSADGSFPSNVFLPTATHDLRLSKAGYSNLVHVGVISAPAAGSTRDLGERLLLPLDTNANTVADTWETIFFGTNAFVALADDDHDGVPNLHEYWAGTDPTNAASVFESDQMNLTNGLTLRWPVTPGRVYRVLSTSSLITDHWSLSAGPWTAAVGQATMQWTAPLSAATGSYFGVQGSSR